MQITKVDGTKIELYEELSETADAARQKLDENFVLWRCTDDPEKQARILEDMTHTAQFDLAGTLSRLRHHLPGREDATLERLKTRGRMYRYFIVWPDAETFRSEYYSQRPAAVRKFRMWRKEYPELRLYDTREQEFIEDDPQD